MNQHVKSVHEKQKPFRCQICKKDFASNDNMKFHLKKCTWGKKTF